MIAQTVGGPLHAFARLQEKKSFAYSAGKKPNKGKRRAAHVIDEKPMCKACFAGKAIFSEEALPGGDGLHLAF